MTPSFYTFFRKSITLLLPGILLGSSLSSAQKPDEVFERFKDGTMDLITLSEVLPMLADAERRPQIRTAILEAEKPPLKDMVALLDHPDLAVRLGALELLEEMAGGDFSYNPWNPAQAPENLGPLARWKAWAGEENQQAAGGAIFSDEQRRGYLRDLLGSDADKSARARRMLEAEGMAAIGYLETFLTESTTLPPGGRARVREAQYQIALTRQLGDQATIVARQLAFGSRDQLLSALSSVRGAGMFAIPILSDFISHPDSLVRETAIDSLLVSSGETAVPIIAPLLAAEPDVNVIHGALRRLKSIRTQESEKLVAKFIPHADEDLLVSAIQTSLTLSGDNDRYRYGNEKAKKPPETDKAIIECLKDPRWRVRANALEYIAKRKLSAAKDPSIALLDDTDGFVRFAAIQAVAALGAKESLPKLKSMLMADAEMVGPVIEGYSAMKARLDDEMLKKLDTYPPDSRLAVIRVAQSVETMADLLLRFANDADMDVSCAALSAISASQEKLKDKRFSSVIVNALRLNQPEKTAAILERLDLPRNESGNRIHSQMLSMLNDAPKNDGPTALDPLYAAFAAPEGGASELAPETPTIDNAQAQILKELAKHCTPESPPALRSSAALNLAKIGDPVGIATLIADIPQLTTAQKISICEALNSVSTKEAQSLLRSLFADPVAEVRAAAINCTLSEADAKPMIQLALDEVLREGTLIQPDEMYGYRFDYAARGNHAMFRPWCLKLLDNKAATSSQIIIGCIAARHCANPAITAALLSHTSSKVAIVRRAAWHSLLTARPNELATHAKAIAEDDEAFVREVLPDRITKPHYTWQHRFSDARAVRDNHYDYQSKITRTDDATRALLTRMSEADPSPLVRFEAGFALLQQSAPIDLDAFVRLLPKLSKETNATQRISSWLQANASRATPALRPLLAVIDSSKMQPDKLRALQARINPTKEKGLLTFASLAALDVTKGKDAPLLAAEEAPADAVKHTSLEVIVFYKPGCAECAKTRQYLEALKTDFPLMKMVEHNILDSDGLLLNQSLCEWFNAPTTRHGVAPAVFAQGGFVIGPELSPATLGSLLANTMKEPQDDAWMKLSEPRKAEAKAAVEKRYETITLPIVLLGGLLDGINPCAFATIIFFLSYLQIARRTPREMLMVGAAFISAVFIAYLAAGLLLYQVLETLIERFAGVQLWMNILFGMLALVAACLSLRDALRARAGRMDEMTLQLPSMLKDRIRGVVRSGARARRFVIAAFVSGLVISLLELACTGQVYAPIIYQIQKGRLDAVLWLVIYNLAFVTPLIVIFLLAYSGLRSETLIAFQKKHTFAVKLGLALLFLGLAMVILLGGKLMN
jgi:cytochrome c biogenesis protein CcdA/HEAT repeat protein